MLDKGVKLALGTDIYFMSMAWHGRNAYELELMTDFGMTPMEAIIAGTKTASEAMELQNQVGTLEKGKLADLIVVQGNPLKDIRVLQPPENIRLVMKDGVIEVNRKV